MRATAQWFLARTSRRRVLVALAVMVVVQAVGALARSHPDLSRVPDSMPDLHPTYDGPGLVGLIATLADHPVATVVTYGLDLLNPTTAAAFFGLLLASLLLATRLQDTLWRHAIPALLVGVGLDLVENAIVLALVASYPGEHIAAVAPVLKAITLAKLGLFAVAFASVLALSIAWVRRRRRPA